MTVILPIAPNVPIYAQLRPVGLLERSGRSVMLYRFRDAGGCLLYIGVTVNPSSRWQSHKTSAEWWPLVTSVDLEEYPHEHSAVDAEVAAIRSERPIYNRRSAVADSAHTCGTTVERPALLSTVLPRTPVSGMEGKRKGRGREFFGAHLNAKSSSYVTRESEPIGIEGDS